MLEDDVQNDQDPLGDPFTKHLHFDLGNELLVSLSKTPPTVEITNELWPVLGNLQIVIPRPVETALKKIKPKISIVEEKVYAATGTVPHILAGVKFSTLHIKSQIHGNIVSANKKNLIKRDLDLTEVFTPLQKELFSIINNYQDIYFPYRNFSNADEIRYTYCLHAVNHMMKTRTKIIHHNAKLAKKTDLSEEFRDQGLVRPKVRLYIVD